MLILLPPSETKRPGGEGRALDLSALALPSLLPQRQSVVDALVRLCADDPDRAAKVLKLSPRQHGELEGNARLRESATRPAVDRYTGVLFDALDAGSLQPAARRWLGAHVLVHSAPFGPVGALDPIPAYRLAAGVSLPGLPSLTRVWADAVTDALAALDAKLVLDLRSEAYAVLGPVPAGVPSAYVRVVSETDDGTVRALNHFNKHAKGAFVRDLARARPRSSSLAGLRRWAAGAGWTLRPGAPGEIELVV